MSTSVTYFSALILIFRKFFQSVDTYIVHIHIHMYNNNNDNNTFKKPTHTLSTCTHNILLVLSYLLKADDTLLLLCTLQINTNVVTSDQEGF